jgi:chromosome segregation ATPase
LVDDLKEGLQKAEAASEEFRKQVEVLQTRLDDALKDQGKMEDRLHEEEERVEMLENEKRESQRHRNDLERIFEAERVSVMKDKEDSQTREEELHDVIQRLKENLAQKESRSGSEDGRTPRQSGSFNAAQAPRCLILILVQVPLDHLPLILATLHLHQPFSEAILETTRN